MKVVRDALRLVRDLFRVRQWSAEGRYDLTADDLLRGRAGRPPTRPGSPSRSTRVADPWQTSTPPLSAPSSRPTTSGARCPTSSTPRSSSGSPPPSPASPPTRSGATRVLVAHDMRPSGPEFAAAFARGATAQGVDVVHLGLASTDLLFFAAGHFDAPGAMLTASHNPAQYNGIKLCLAGARPVGEDTGLAPDQGRHPRRARRRRRARHDLQPRRRPRRFRRARALVRRPRRPAPAEGRRRHGQRHGRSHGAGRVRGPALLARGALRRAGRHLPEPPGRPHPAREPRRSPGPGAGHRRRRGPRLRR